MIFCERFFDSFLGFFFAPRRALGSGNEQSS